MRVLHVLAQRPSLTGSGVTVDALVRNTDADHFVVCAQNAGDRFPTVGGLAPSRIRVLEFESGPLDFPVPGMSDVMPYRTSVWSRLSTQQLDRYRTAWHRFLRGLPFQPDLVHSNHVWLVSGLLKDVVDVPVVTHVHATGLRQLQLCPHLADEVVQGCRRNTAFATLHHGLSRDVRDVLGTVDAVEVGAGYADGVFETPEQQAPSAEVLFVGKLAASKGLPWLLDAVERLGVHLHVAGRGDPTLQARAEALPNVTVHGRMPLGDLAALMRRCDVFVLPSLFEGLGLVLVEAYASGCRLVATDFEGATRAIGPRVGDAITIVRRPRLIGPDTPVPEDLPAFVDRLETAIADAVGAGPIRPDPAVLESFTWRAVGRRVERLWATSSER